MESVTRPPTHFSVEKNGRHLTFPLCTSLLYTGYNLRLSAPYGRNYPFNKRTDGWLVDWLVGWFCFLCSM